MKIIKKNQLTILVIALMLVTAGYLNYTSYNGESIETYSNDIINGQNIAGIGDAKLVNSQELIENTATNSLEIENRDNISESEKIPQENNSEETKKDNIIETSSNINSDEYFAKSRLQRENMYSQMIESYQKILESSSISTEQKAISQQEIDNINKIKNAIMISENLIKTKGFEECVIFVNDKSINVIVKDAELASEKIAQIQNIVARELNAEVENIHITNK